MTSRNHRTSGVGYGHSPELSHLKIHLNIAILKFASDIIGGTRYSFFTKDDFRYSDPLLNQSLD